MRTGNKQTFDYVKDLEVTCRFKEPLTRENIYKELEKTKWPLTRVVGMVLRPGGLADFTLKSKKSALQFAQTLNTLESIRSATAYAYRVVEVRIDFIPPGFPSEPILAYLEQNHGEIVGTPIRIADRFNIQTGTRVFKMIFKGLQIQLPATPILKNISFECDMRANKPPVATALRKTIWNVTAKKKKI